ncbi:hypothetical protein [Luteibacter sp. SG786]|uniref:hypothetical protein n=1 Tax=Luteibacter sp. SG786 TaxID=2587130 RepID=UPI0014208251|nr:hypothetical protein [Luteibacter sp. SG786]NII53537.1 hypothetical protein [Luteibacter sp. SG786]
MSKVVRERPILFSAPMVRAILEGRKTVTRRVVKLRHSWELEEAADGSKWPWHPDYVTGGEWDGWADCPYGMPGDRLWVREAWRVPASLDDLSGKRIAEKCLEAGYRKPWAPISFEADGALSSAKDWRDFGSTPGEAVPGRYRHARFMPRWASRITLEVTAVRVERLQDISEVQAIAEGIERVSDNFGNGPAYCDYSMGRLDDTAEWFSQPIPSFRSLWESINGSWSWADNPWVWVVEFRRVEGTP